MTDPSVELPIVIDSTMMTCFRACHQKFYLEFVRGLRPPGLSIDLHAGACFALAIEVVGKEVWLNHRPLNEALLRARAAFMVAWGDFEIPTWKRTAKTMDRMWEAVESYFHEYPPHTDPVQPYLDVNGKPTFEYTFAIPLEPCVHKLAYPGKPDNSEMFPCHPTGSPFIYAGKFDLLGQKNGRPTPRDEKTTGGSIGVRWPEQWRLRHQFMGYVWACRQCGLDVQSMVVRGVAIQKTQIDHAEAEITYSDFLLDRWYEQLRQDLWKLRRCWDEGYWDWNYAEACTAYGNCVFMDACSARDPEPWLSTFEVRRWNPLHKNPAPAPRPLADMEAF